ARVWLEAAAAAELASGDLKIADPGDDTRSIRKRCLLDPGRLCRQDHRLHILPHRHKSAAVGCGTWCEDAAVEVIIVPGVGRSRPESGRRCRKRCAEQKCQKNIDCFVHGDRLGEALLDKQYTAQFTVEKSNVKKRGRPLFT